MALQEFYSCPTGCDVALILPAIDAEQDCTTYPILDSQVCDIVIKPDAANDPLDWTVPDTPALATGEIDNTEALGAKSKHLVGEGGVAEPEAEVQEYPKNQNKVVKRTYTLEMTFKNMSAEQYAFFQVLQCGQTGFTFYYANLAGFIFGKAGGIEPLSIDVVMPLGAARGDKQLATIRITFEAAGDPNRYPSPLA